MMRNFFSRRVVNLWNSLPQKIVKAKSVDIFKVETRHILD